MTELDISNNKRLTWQVAKPLASLLSHSDTHTQLHSLTVRKACAGPAPQNASLRHFLRHLAVPLH